MWFQKYFKHDVRIRHHGSVENSYLWHTNFGISIVFNTVAARRRWLNVYFSYVRNRQQNVSFILGTQRLRSLLTNQLDVHQSQCATIWDHFRNSTPAVITDQSAGCPSTSRSVQPFETEPSPLLVLGCGTVGHQTLPCVTHCHGSVKNSKHIF